MLINFEFETALPDEIFMIFTLELQFTNAYPKIN